MEEQHDFIEDKWDKISQGIHKIASEVLGKLVVEQHYDSYDEEWESATERKD